MAGIVSTPLVWLLEGTGGGAAHTGVRRPGGAGTESAKAERTGDATADGPGSSAVTGIDYT
ncbi:hypothetical protein [Streptomyces decoyicus]